MSDIKFDIEEAKKSGVYLSGTSGSGKTVAAKSVIKKLMDSGITCYIFDPSQAWVKNSPINDIVIINSIPTILDFEVGKSLVFDISHLKVEEQKIIVADFCKGIYTSQVDMPEENRHWIFIFFEEAQIYLQQNSLRSKSSSEIMRLITVGRNFKIRYGLITQFPSTIDKLPVKMTKQRYFGYTDEKNDKDYIYSFIGDEVEDLKLLKLGEFIYSYGGKIEHVQFPNFISDAVPVYCDATKPLESKEKSATDSFDSSNPSHIIIVLCLLVLILAFAIYVYTHSSGQRGISISTIFNWLLFFLL